MCLSQCSAEGICRERGRVRRIVDGALALQAGRGREEGAGERKRKKSRCKVLQYPETFRVSAPQTVHYGNIRPFWRGNGGAASRVKELEVDFKDAFQGQASGYHLHNTAGK